MRSARHMMGAVGVLAALAHVSAPMRPSPPTRPRMIVADPLPKITSRRTTREPAKAGGPGGEGTPRVSAFMPAAPVLSQYEVRPERTYRAARREHAKRDRKAWKQARKEGTPS